MDIQRNEEVDLLERQPMSGTINPSSTNDGQRSVRLYYASFKSLKRFCMGGDLNVWIGG